MIKRLWRQMYDLRQFRGQYDIYLSVLQLEQSIHLALRPDKQGVGTRWSAISIPSESMVVTYVYAKNSAPRAGRGFLNDVQNINSNCDITMYGGIFRTYILLLFISCARLLLFRRSFFLFYYLVRTTFLFRRSFFLFYYLVRTTFFYFVDRFFLFSYLVRTTFFISYVVVSFLLSRAHDFFFIS